MKKVMKKLFVLFLGSGLFMIAQTEGHAEDEWRRKVSLGYNKTSGNTDNSELTMAGEAKRVMTEAEFLAKADVYYSSADKKMDTQKWSGLLRYFYNFGEERKWFNTYQLLVEHDRFSDIDYRILPSSGIGYWLSKEDDWTAMVEGSLGYEVTDYGSNKPDDEEAVLIGRTYLEKKVFENARISEDLSVIPSLDGGGVRIKSETEFTNPIGGGLELSIKFIVDHDSEPAADIKKTDTRLVTALKYSF